MNFGLFIFDARSRTLFATFQISSLVVALWTKRGFEMFKGMLPGELTLWNFLDSQFLNTIVSAAVAIVLAFVAKKVTDAAKDSAAEQGAVSAVEQARQIEAEAEQEAEAFAEAGPQEVDRRQEARAVADEAKKYLDGKAVTARDGRHRRTFEALSRYDYIPLSVALSVRNEIKPWQLAAAVSLFSLWKQFERGKASQKRVPQEVVDELNEYLQDLKREI